MSTLLVTNAQGDAHQRNCSSTYQSETGLSRRMDPHSYKKYFRHAAENETQQEPATIISVKLRRFSIKLVDYRRFAGYLAGQVFTCSANDMKEQ